MNRSPRVRLNRSQQTLHSWRSWHPVIVGAACAALRGLPFFTFHCSSLYAWPKGSTTSAVAYCPCVSLLFFFSLSLSLYFLFFYRVYLSFFFEFVFFFPRKNARSKLISPYLVASNRCTIGRKEKKKKKKGRKRQAQNEQERLPVALCNVTAAAGVSEQAIEEQIEIRQA